MRWEVVLNQMQHGGSVTLERILHVINKKGDGMENILKIPRTKRPLHPPPL